MNTPLMCAPNNHEKAPPSPSETRKRPKKSPRRAFSVAARAFLSLALATCAFGAAASAQTISIAPPANTPNTPEGNSGQTNFEFTVSVDQVPTGTYTVNFTVNNGTAVGNATGTGADFANGVGSVLVNGAPSTGNTLTFTAGGATTQSIIVPVTGDTLFEADETFSVSLTNAQGGATLGTSSATATIVNDDNQPFISVADAAPVVEGNTGASNNANFTVSLSAPSGQDVTFTYNTLSLDSRNAGDGINGDADFVRQTNQIGIIPAGQSSTNVPVPIIGDLIDEADGQFLLEISNVNGANISNASGVGTITDDDGPIVTVADASANERDGQIVFRVQLSAPSPQGINVTYRTSSNSATVGFDYGASGSTTEVTGSVFFPPFDGDPSTGVPPIQEITIPIIDDNIIEPSEIFGLTLVSADNSASITGPGSRRFATGTINDDDGPPNLRIQGPTGGVIEGNSGNTPAVFTISLTNPSSRTITFRYQTVAGTATVGQDFINATGTATIPANQLSTTVTVNVIGDLIDEANETFGLRVFSPNLPEVTFGGATEQTVNTTIIDDDGPAITVAPASQTVTEGNNGARTAAAFTVKLSANSPQVVKVTYTLGSQDGNEATRGTDYTSSAATGVLTFQPGVNTLQVPVSIIGDNIKENDEIISLTLSAPDGGSLGAPSTGTITIRDDDALPVVSITGPNPTREGSSGGITSFVFRVALDRPSSSDITVNYTVNNGTAVADSDFTLPAGNQLTFLAGSVGPLNITVPVIADRLNEDDETFSVTLSAPTNARIGVGNAIATIINDDAIPSLTIRDVAGLETGDPPPQGQQQGPRILQFPVNLSAASGKDITFSYQTVGAGAGNTFTAISGVDFVPAQGQLTIPAGQTSGLINVTVVGDTLDEDNETFGMSLTNVTNATFGRASAIGTISDDDNAPDVAIAAPNANNTAIEPYATTTNGTPLNGRNAIFPVTLSTASGRTVTVRYSIAPGAAPAADNRDFLISSADQTRIFQTGTITFVPVNGVTPTTQNITLFPRGDDGDEDDVQNYVVNITAVNANVPAAGASATSTIADRDPVFNNFSPDAAFESYNGNLNNGTVITITGNQFITDNINRVAAVRFAGTDGIARDATILTRTATAITCRLPQNAYSSFITVVLTSGRVLNSIDEGSRRVIYAQPIVTSFSPTFGVPAATKVTIRGRHFRDARNPVTGVLFNGLASTAQSADIGYTIINDTTIEAYVPRGATSGPISIRTAFGGDGPGSIDGFTVNTFVTGGLRFVAADTSPIYENARATIRSSNKSVLQNVRTFDLQLRPATQNNGGNTPIAPRRTVDVTVSLNAAIPAGSSQTLPTIQLDPTVNNGRIEGITVIRGSSNNFTFRIAAGRDPNLTIPIAITFAGDDNAPSATQGALSGATDASGLTLPAANSGVNMTFRAEVTASGDPELYPNGEFSELTFERRDIHTFATDTGTALRTSEDQNSDTNRTNFRLDLANLDFPNPEPPATTVAVDNPINVDARPKADVTVTLTSNRPDEGLLTYYVLVNGQKVYPSGANPQASKPVIYAVSPTRAEYYRNPHYIEVVGQDDDIADGDQNYRITATAAVSRDPEYNLPLALPFDLVNTDNEQRATGPGFLYSKSTLTTDESGQEDVFTTSLRTQPSGNVTVNFQSTRVDEFLFVNPNNPNGPGLDNISITYLRTGTGDGKTTTLWRTPISVRVRGVDDDVRDGDQQALIDTSVVTSTDPAYGSIDPPNLVVTNRDNEANGITVFPTTLTVNENATSTFTIRLNARPTSNVVITLASGNTSIATIVGATTLTFTPSNFSTPQTVTVRGVPDGGFTAQRTASIITSQASSGDPNFNQLDVADVTVTVFNNDSAFVVNAPTTGLRTSESGQNDLFTVSLGQAPTTTVRLILSVTPASEARLSRTTAGATPSLTLTFTPTNYANPQTVNVIGQDDDIADGDKAFTILGRVDTTDPIYANQPFDALQGVNADNESGTGGGGNANSPTFAANSTYTFSMPYSTTNSAVGTIPVSSLFTQSTTDFKIYGFNVGAQKNSRIIGGDFTLLPSNAVIHRGIGYLLQTGSTPLTLKTPPASVAYTGTGFSFVLTRNANFVNQTGQSNSNNGLNFIGFPFNPAQFGSVSFASAAVSDGTNTYQSVREAAAAGVISDKLYTMNAKGVLTEVAASSQVLRPYGAYFVRIYRDKVTLTFRSPSAN